MLIALLVPLALTILLFSFVLMRSALRQHAFPNFEALVVGAIVCFFDALGIGSFAPTAAWLKFRRLVPDGLIPQTMLVGLTPPSIAEAIIFLALLGGLVDAPLLVGCVLALLLGGLAGVPLVTRARVWVVQLVVAIALIVAAIAYAMTNLHLFPGGGTASSLPLTLMIVAIAATFAVNAPAQTQTTTVAKSEPRKASVDQTVDFTATIIAIDRTTRDLTLKGPKGNWVVVSAGPEVKNFDQLNVGDKVHTRYNEALVLELKKGNDMAVTRTDEKSAVGAVPGAQPAGVAGRRITVVADVIAVNKDTQTVTLRGPQLTAELKISDPDQFRRIKKGDQVYAVYTQALAMLVEPSPKK